MTVLEFMSEHPVLTGILGFFAIIAAESVLLAPFKLGRRWLRSRDIRERGWPPEHVDADGDFRPTPPGAAS